MTTMTPARREGSDSTPSSKTYETFTFLWPIRGISQTSSVNMVEKNYAV
jgi:hypothetical protein